MNVKNRKPIKNDDLGDILTTLGLDLDKDTKDALLPDPDLLMYYRNLQDRIIWLDDSIDITTLEISKLILHFNNMDKDIPVEERKPIKIMIFSYGGEVSPCFTLLDTIAISKTPVYTYNMGISMSAALLILLAGHKRFGLKRSVALAHSGSGGTQGTYEQTEAQMKDYKHAVQVMRDYILERTSIDAKTLNKYKSTEWYMYIEDQLKYGVVHNVIESVEDI